MRVLQLIDSLETGGAERVAVNLANTLALRDKASFLCATRKEGLLKEGLSENVQYLFLNKKRTIDFAAIKNLSLFVKRNKINIIHAHSTSFFLATIINIFQPQVKIVWHDHYGKSEFLSERKSKFISLCSKYFSHVIVVNKALEQWAIRNLKTKNIDFLTNFSVQDAIKPQTNLKGENGKRIIHLANLRPQKNHELLIEAFQIVIKKYPDWTLHCVGEDFFDDNSVHIKNLVLDKKLDSNIFFYGAKLDITNILTQCNIGVLSSKSEGLPLAILEYGMSNLPIVTTNVGDCSLVVSNLSEGFLIESDNSELLSNAILKLIENPTLRDNLAENLKKRVLDNFSEEKIMKQLLNIYNSVLK